MRAVYEVHKSWLLLDHRSMQHTTQSELDELREGGLRSLSGRSLGRNQVNLRTPFVGLREKRMGTSVRSGAEAGVG